MNNSFNKVGRIFVKESNSSIQLKKEIIGEWKLQNQFVPENHTMYPTLVFKEDSAGYVGIAMYSISGGYIIDDDIIEIYFNNYSAVTANSQNIEEQIVKLKKLDDDKIIVVKGMNDVIYENEVNGGVITIRDVFLKEGFIFERESK